MQKFFFPFLLLCFSFSAAWALPPWVQFPAEYYDSALYEWAVGVGESKEEAEKDAYASLARRFGVSVVLSEEYRQIGESEAEFDKKLALSSRQDFVSAKTAEIASDDACFYALVVLEKSPAIRVLKESIAAAEAQLAEYVSRSRWEKDPSRLHRLFREAESLAEKTERLSAQLGVLSPSSERAAKPGFSSQYFRKRAEALEQILPQSK